MKKLFLLTATLAMTHAASAIKTADMVPHPADALPVIGTLAPDASKPYSRLPDSLKSQVREDLWNLGLNSAGMAIRFASDATDIGARWTNLNRFNMNHMTPTGIRGLDLYVLCDDSTWTTVASGRPVLNSSTTSARIMEGMSRRMRDYMLYLPLYDGVDSIFILTDSAAVVTAPIADLPRREHPMVMYGTSLLQGGCASRPGMVHTSILERMYNIEVMNLGFSGNARLDPEIARLMASADASVFVIDALPNCTADRVAEKGEEFIGIIRSLRPDTPILLIESPMFPSCRFNPEVYQALEEKNLNLRKIFDKLSVTDKNIYYMTADEVLPDVEATVDNYHFTDTGFANFAKAMKPILDRIFESK